MIAYKVVYRKGNKLVSVYADRTPWMVTYQLGKISKPNVLGSWLMVFKRLQDVYAWPNLDRVGLQIFRVEVDQLRRPFFSLASLYTWKERWRRYTKHNNKLPNHSWPKGTRFCTRVKLLKRVN